MPFVFAWDDWNREHVKKHGCSARDAKYIIQHAQTPFPREIGGDKYLVWGQAASGEHLEVIFAFKVAERLAFTDLELLDWGTMIDYPATVSIYICHAMPMKVKQLRQYRRIRSRS
jgi:hypothetical protein